MSDKNIDKDLEILKEFIKKDYEPWSFYEKQGDELFELQEAIENVLSELEKNKKAVDNLLVKNAELRVELETWKKIAEKLAGYGFNCYYGSPLKFDSPEELIEIARKETEDEELARKEVENGKE